MCRLGVEVGTEAPTGSLISRSSADGLCQQDGQGECGLLQGVLTYAELFGNRVTAVQLPIGSQSDFKGVVDLVELKACI